MKKNMGDAMTRGLDPIIEKCIHNMPTVRANEEPPMMMSVTARALLISNLHSSTTSGILP